MAWFCILCHHFLEDQMLLWLLNRSKLSNLPSRKAHFDKNLLTNQEHINTINSKNETNIATNFISTYSNSFHLFLLHYTWLLPLFLTSFYLFYLFIFHFFKNEFTEKTNTCEKHAEDRNKIELHFKVEDISCKSNNNAKISKRHCFGWLNHTRWGEYHVLCN